MKRIARFDPRLLGVAAAIVAYVIDQASKFWLLDVYDIGARQPIRLAPAFDVVLAWNEGISYSLFTTQSDEGRWILLSVTLLITAAIGLWMWRAHQPTTSVALGLIVGGALGNATDRWLRGAVADFFYFHVGSFHWYVFNLADCAIVLGVALLLCDSLFTTAKPEALM
jgi:signal peptidase II